jgi:hypothetical protein
MLDEELNQLPENYRLPLILCYLQGLTNEEAARRLGWPLGSMSYRLARGREMLRERMQRRRRDAAAGFFSLALVLGVSEAIMPSHLADATVRAAVVSARGSSALLAVNANVRALVDGILKGIPKSSGKSWLSALPTLGIALVVAFALSMLVAFAGEYSTGQGRKSLGLSGGGPANVNGSDSSGSNPSANGTDGASKPPTSCHGP